MPTSLVSTGVQFPDLTTQTTAAVAGGGYALNAYVSPTTWSKPAGLKAVKVTVVGAGGSGVASPAGSALNRGSSGGGGGGAAIEYIPAPSIPGPVAVTAGPGTNSFGAFCSATAGADGVLLVGTGGAQGGVGGVGSGGNIDIAGQAGTAIVATPSPVIAIGGGTGGSSILGGGGRSGAGPTGVARPGSAGGNYGGGGGGGTATNSTGGAGAPGIVIVEEFY
jgi:hypothetical protein